MLPFLLAAGWAVVCAWQTSAVIAPGTVRFGMVNDIVWDPATFQLSRTGGDPYVWVDVPRGALPIRRVTFEFGGRADPVEGRFYVFQSRTRPAHLGLRMTETRVETTESGVRVTADLADSTCLRLDLPDYLGRPLELRSIAVESAFVGPWRWSFRLLVLSGGWAAIALFFALGRLRERVWPLAEDKAAPGPAARRLIAVWFAGVTALHAWIVSEGWSSPYLAGHEFRQTQTAVSAHFIQQDHTLALAYPTPVLGKPWSIPFEFPLYQWTVVGVARATGLPLVPAGRLVSLACFLGMLPALWGLAGRLGAPREGRWIVLGFVLLCPLHLLYARAFLIETMALLGGVWFLHALILAVEQRHLGWSLVAVAAGTVCGLVKVTTFIVYLMPAAVCIAGRLRAVRREPAAALRLAGRAAAILVLPLALTAWWLAFSEQVKAANVCARSLRAGALMGWNFGTLDDRFDPALWREFAGHVTEGVLPAAVLGVVAAAAWLAPGRARRGLGAALAVVAAGAAVFPTLYATHEYYAVATATALLAGCGLVVAALWAARGTRWLAVVLLVFLPAAEVVQYWRAFRPRVEEGATPARELAAQLARLTRPGDVLVVAGFDWNSTLPFYSRRRALLLRDEVIADGSWLAAALAGLEGETVGAVVLWGAERDNAELAGALRSRLDLGDEPVLRTPEAVVWRPRACGAGPAGP